MSIIKRVIGRQIIDSRGTPTVEAEVFSENKPFFWRPKENRPECARALAEFAGRDDTLPYVAR